MQKSIVTKDISLFFFSFFLLYYLSVILVSDSTKLMLTHAKKGENLLSGVLRRRWEGKWHKTTNDNRNEIKKKKKIWKSIYIFFTSSHKPQSHSSFLMSLPCRSIAPPQVAVECADVDIEILFSRPHFHLRIYFYISKDFAIWRIQLV